MRPDAAATERPATGPDASTTERPATGPAALLAWRGLRSAHAGPFDGVLMPGQCLSVTGPSGAGKSLMLRMIADLDPHEGGAWLRGQSRASMPAPCWRRQVRFAAAEPGWWLADVERHFETFPTMLAGQLGLRPGIATARIADCSTGERRRLSLLRALQNDPELLLLDEPTSALDPASVVAMEALLRQRLAAGAAIVLVTHDAGQAERIGTLHMRIEAGRMVSP